MAGPHDEIFCALGDKVAKRLIDDGVPERDVISFLEAVIDDENEVKTAAALVKQGIEFKKMRYLRQAV